MKLFPQWTAKVRNKIDTSLYKMCHVSGTGSSVNKQDLLKSIAVEKEQRESAEAIDRHEAWKSATTYTLHVCLGHLLLKQFTNLITML